MVIPGMVFSPTANYVQPPVAGYGIRLPGATSGAASIKPAAVAGSVEFTLPPSTVAGGVMTDVVGLQWGHALMAWKTARIRSR